MRSTRLALLRQQSEDADQDDQDAGIDEEQERQAWLLQLELTALNAVSTLQMLREVCYLHCHVRQMRTPAFGQLDPQQPSRGQSTQPQ